MSVTASFDVAAARAADEATAITGEVLLAEDVIGEVRRVAIATTRAAGLLWRPGQSVEVEVAPRSWRRYLIASSNGVGRIELVVALTSGGPGAWWAATADGGDVVRLRALRDERVMTAGAARHVIAGDETAIGLCGAFARWLPPGAVVGLVEVAPWAPWTRRAPHHPAFSTVRRAFAEPGRQLAASLVRAVRDGDAIHVVGSRLLVDRCVQALPSGLCAHALVTWID
jgi:hypothetical protein